MIKERWTVLFLKDEANAVRQYSLSLSAARRLLVGLGIFGALLATSVAFFVYDAGARARAGLLARENRLLEAELLDIQVRLNDFDQQMEGLAKKDQQVRLLAGRIGIDDEVFEVGVGGPGLASPGEGELWELDPGASELAYATRYDLMVLERKADLLDESFDETTMSLEGQKGRLEAIPSIFPAGGLLSSAFSSSRKHPIHQIYQPHQGIDVYNVSGTPIVATGDGVVTFVGWKRGYGNTVEIDHGYGATSLYAHASKLLVYTGQRVQRNDVLAQVGCTGDCTAPHVHYEVHIDGIPRNPINYVLGYDTP